MGIVFRRKNHNEKETRAILRGARGLGWHPLQHGYRGRHDYFTNRPYDTFTVDGLTMSASEFGNYIAGYAGTYNLGAWGYAAMRLAGNFFAIEGRFWQREDEESIRDINHGAIDGLRDRLKDEALRLLLPYARFDL